MPPGGLLALVLVVALAGFGPAHTDSTRGMAQVSPTPSLGFDIRVLLKEFQVAQQNQLKALLAKGKSSGQGPTETPSEPNKRISICARRKPAASSLPISTREPRSAPTCTNCWLDVTLSKRNSPTSEQKQKTTPIDGFAPSKTSRRTTLINSKTPWLGGSAPQTGFGPSPGRDLIRLPYIS